MVRKQQLQMK